MRLVRQHEARYALAQLGYKRAYLLRSVAAVHLPEYACIDVLERHVEVLDDLVLARDDVYELVRQLVRVEVVQPYPVYAVYLHQLCQQPRQVPAGDVLAVAGQVLATSITSR